MKLLKMVLFLVLFLFITTACGGGESSGKQAEYDTTKKMVVDILQTDEGKKALTETLADEQMKQQLIMESDMVKEAINESVASDKGKKMWESLFKDPQFAKEFAKSMEDEQKKLMKDLMNDPDYQKQMIDLAKDPEITSHMTQLLKSQEFGQHLENSIEKTLENPIFQAKIQEILLKAAEEQTEENANGGQGEEQENQEGQGQQKPGEGESGGEGGP